MPRFVYRLWLRPDPDAIETYVRGHLDPFAGLYDLMRNAGIRRYTIWLDEADLLLTFEADDAKRSPTLDMDNPVHRQWAETMRRLADERVEREGAGRPTEVLVLDPDADPAPAQMTYRLGLRPGPDVMEAVAVAHRTMPSDVVDTLRAAGIRRQWTWIEDGDAWTYLECDDLDATEAALAAAPAHRSWSASIAGMLNDGTRREGRRRTREVFRCD
jgi:L-rhamnose mutarotase